MSNSVNGTATDTAADTVIDGGTATASSFVDIDKLPADVPIRIGKADDGSTTIIREIDDAPWNGEEFVVPEAPLLDYGVIVTVKAVDERTARQIVAEALTAGGVTAGIESLAELIEGRRAEIDAQIRKEIGPAIRVDEAGRIHTEFMTQLNDFLTEVVKAGNG